MKKTFTIQDLAEGKCAVINDGTLKQLREVLSLAFPRYRSKPEGNGVYYRRKGDAPKWTSFPGNATILPTQSVKDFLPVDKFREFIEAFERGEIVQVYNRKFKKWEDKRLNVYSDGHEYRIKPKEKWSPKRGDMVLVKYTNPGRWVPRIYLETIEGANKPIIVVRESSNDRFRKGETFTIATYLEMIELPKVEVTREEIAAWKDISIEQLIIKD